MSDANGQGVPVGPEAVIDALMQRVQALTMENVMLQAMLNQRDREASDAVPDSQPG